VFSGGRGNAEPVYSAITGYISFQTINPVILFFKISKTPPRHHVHVQEETDTLADR